ncbi:MAG: anaerobic carbon-monoxide dehydrogenase catalytic subunit [Nitrospirae bacterium]|nr:MAG: anaerobic carbon-monoxide dehydrogenase catalytic subunit [Nitrospirota bacterium]
MADIKMKTVDPLAGHILEWAEEHNLETAFERSERIKPCPIGKVGACCKMCHMGPCRIVGADAEKSGTGVCGATLPVIVARNFARMCAAGSAAHSDHARDMAFTLLGAATGEAKDFTITDVRKLKMVAGYLDIETDGKSKEEIAKEIALKFIEQFGQQRGEIVYAKRAPEKRQEIWRKHGVYPRGIDREIAETMHRTHMGVDQDPLNLLLAAAKVSLADGWGGSMMSTDITDILFGTPWPRRGEISLGLFEEDMVNLVIHGHEPTLAEMIVDVHNSPEIVEYAKSKGAKGVNLVGMCCTANEVLMRHGIPSAGGFLQQELGVLTGLLEAVVVDVQCIMPAIVQAAKNFHTKVITTTYKGKMVDAVHVEYDEHRAKEIAKEICKIAIDNFPNRTTKGSRIHESTSGVVGFSHEYITYMQGGVYRQSFRPLNDAIMQGRIRGVVGLAGCNNPRIPQDSLHVWLADEFIREDILVVQTGCSAAACGKSGMMTPEMALAKAGPGLKEVCEAIGIPPILHLGACVDNSRILTIAAHMAKEGGLGDDIGGLPCVGIAPEWMSEKALAIGMYFVASGVPTIFGGGESPVQASSVVRDILENKFWDIFNAGFYFESDPQKIYDLTLSLIDKARERLKIKKYERGKFGEERILRDMAARRALERAGCPGPAHPDLSEN